MAHSTSPIIIEFPYELGTFRRKGSFEAPEAIICALKKLSKCSVYSGQMPKYEFDEVLKGPNKLDSYNIMVALQQITSQIAHLLKQGKVPMSIGGDHSITLPIIRAFANFYGMGSFGIIHIDAHSDTSPPIDGFAYHHGSFMRNIIEEKLVNPENIYQVGIRGQVREGGYLYARNCGTKIVTTEDILALDCNITKVIPCKDMPYYLTFDIDVVDPAFAPATGWPMPGGLSSFDVLKMIRLLKDYRFIGADLVEVAPCYDSSNITVALASNILFEIFTFLSFITPLGDQ